MAHRLPLLTYRPLRLRPNWQPEVSTARPWMDRDLIARRLRLPLVATRPPELRRRGTKIGRPRTLPLDVVLRITAEAAGGSSLRRIAKGLNSDGVATAQGGREWYASTVRAVILSAKRAES